MYETVTIPRKIYYINSTGQFIFDTGEIRGTNIRQTSIDEDFELYSELKSYNRNLINCVELKVGQYREDFLRCESFRVNPETLQLEFSYANDDTSLEDPVYQMSLSDQVKELEARTVATENMILQMMLERTN